MVCTRRRLPCAERDTHPPDDGRILPTGMADDDRDPAQLFALLASLKKTRTDLLDRRVHASPAGDTLPLSVTSDLPPCPICDAHDVKETHFLGSGMRAFACVVCGHTWYVRPTPRRRLN